MSEVVRVPNLGRSQFVGLGWRGLHMYEDGAVRVMFLAKDDIWYPEMTEPDEEFIEEMLERRAIPGIDYGKKSLVQRLRGDRSWRSMNDLKKQLADLLEKQKQLNDRLKSLADKDKE